MRVKDWRGKPAFERMHNTLIHRVKLGYPAVHDVCCVCVSMHVQMCVRMRVCVVRVLVFSSFMLALLDVSLIFSLQSSIPTQRQLNAVYVGEVFDLAGRVPRVSYVPLA